MNKILGSEPAIFVIFGATGNLTHKKLIPALYELEKANLLPPKIRILGVARSSLDANLYANHLRPLLEKTTRSGFDVKVWDRLSAKIDYFKVDFNRQEDFANLQNRLDELEKERGVCGPRVFYLATIPSVYPPIFQSLKKYKLNLGCTVHKKAARVVIEKPFGKDLASALDLNRRLDEVFSEEQIYRIDHYLAKESVQNILAFRFANEIFEPIMNNKYVDHIQIVQAESGGVEGRGEYYEEAGALRDIVQNHLLQILAVTTMDEPKSFAAGHIREEKVNLLGSVRAIRSDEVEKYVVRGQYAGYRSEEEVSGDSNVETYVAMKIFIDNNCWAGVPIYLMTGKKLEKQLATITIQFKEAGHALFSNLTKTPQPNLLTFQLQPDEGIAIRLVAKKPSLQMELTSVDMEFCYASAFREPQPEAYERLLLDIMLGDQTLFPHREEVLRSWEIVDNILKGWARRPAPKSLNYEEGTWGPKAAAELLQKDARTWLAHELKICQLHH